MAVLLAAQAGAAEGRRQRHRWHRALRRSPISVAGSGLCPGWGAQPDLSNRPGGSGTPRAAVRGWRSWLVRGPDLRGERRRVAEALLPRRRGCDTLNPSRPNSLFIKVLWSTIRSAHCLILLTNMFCSPIKRGLHLSCQSYSAGVF